MAARLGALSSVLALVVMVGCAAGAPAGARSGAAPAAPRGANAPAAQSPAAAPAASAAPTEAPSLVTLKMAAQPSISSAPRYIALDRGYFREVGIDLEEVPSTTSAQMLPSLAAGQIDMGVGGVTSGLFNAVAQGIPVRMTLAMWSATPSDRAGGLIVRKDLADSGQVRDWADLGGLRIAITSKGHETQLALDKALRRGGLSLDDADTTELSYPDMNVALGNQNIDGAITIEPYATLGVLKGFATRFKVWYELIPNDTPASIMFSEDLAEARADVARRFAIAYVRGLRDYDQARTKGKDREAIIGIVEQYVPFLERPMYDQIPWPAVDPGGRVNGEVIAAAQDWFIQHGYVQTRVEMSKVVDNQFADYATAQLGPYQP
jgi:NitT/TauT family transport system substrate-binding protein